MSNKLFFILLFSFLSLAAWSQTGSYLIDSISVQGNKRSRTDLILNELTFQSGDQVSLKEIETSLQFVKDLEFFSAVNYELQEKADSSRTLAINVRDKWTLFPILYFTGTNNSSYFMVGAMDWNFLGRGIFLQASYGLKFQDGLEPQHTFDVESIYRRIAGTPWGLSSKVSSNANAGYVFKDKMKQGTYTHRSKNLSTGLEYNYRNRIIPRIQAGYYHDHFSSYQADDALDVSTNLHRQLRYTLGINIDYLSMVDHRYRGFMASISYTFHQAFDHASFYKLESHTQYHALSENQRFFAIAQAQLSLSNAPVLLYNPTFEKVLRGSTGRNYFYPRIVGGNLEVGISPLSKKWLCLDMVLVADMAKGWNSSSGFSGDIWRYRYGAGLRFSWPGLKGGLISYDLVANEYGQLESHFGMIRFIQ